MSIIFTLYFISYFLLHSYQYMSLGSFICIRHTYGRKLRQVIKDRGDKFLSAGEFLSKSEITPLDIKRAADFTKCPDRHLSGEGVGLRNRVNLSVSFCKSVNESDTSSKVLVTSAGYVPGVDAFLDNFIKHYQSNVKFRESLIVNLMKGYVAKVEGIKNPKYGAKVLNFFLALAASGDKKAFEYISGNLAAVSLRWARVLMSRRRGRPFINQTMEEMVHGVGRIVAKFRHAFGDSMKLLTLTVGVDATCLVQAFQVSASEGVIVGGASPNHTIPIPDNSSKEEVKTLLKACAEGKHGVLTTEVKVAVLSFQEAPPGMCPYVVLAGIPQTTNENNDFAEVCINACKAAAKQVGKLTIVNTSTDGVACEVEGNKKLTCAYLRGEENQVALPDPNHNVKNLRYQLGGGSSPASIGEHVFDPQMLKISGIATELWRIDDYASDALPL